MTSRRDDAPDLTMIAADDALLDALGRGEPAPDDDKLAGLLASWRTDLDCDPPADLDMTAILAELADKSDPAATVADAGATDAGADADAGATDAGAATATVADADDGADPAGDGRPSTPLTPLRPAVAGACGGMTGPLPSVPRRRRWRPGRRATRYLTGVAAALLLIAGLAVGAGQADPHSPLWPLAQVLYPGRADLRLAEYNIDQARAAAADGRYADARRTLDKAAGSVNRIDDRKLADKLRAEIDQIRRTLPADDTRDNAPAGPSPSPSSPTPTGAQSPSGGQGQPGGGQPGGGDPGGDPGGGADPEQPGGGADPEQPGGIIPGIPAIPTPTLPIPVPTLPQLPLGPPS